jgi:hypothetical protein
MQPTRKTCLSMWVHTYLRTAFMTIPLNQIVVRARVTSVSVYDNVLPIPPRPRAVIFREADDIQERSHLVFASCGLGNKFVSNPLQDVVINFAGARPLSEDHLRLFRTDN